MAAGADWMSTRENQGALATGLPSTCACLSRHREAGASCRGSTPSPTSQADLTRRDSPVWVQTTAWKAYRVRQTLRFSDLVHGAAPGAACGHETVPTGRKEYRPLKAQRRRKPRKEKEIMLGASPASPAKANPCHQVPARGLKIGADLTWSHSQFGPASV